MHIKARNLVNDMIAMTAANVAKAKEDARNPLYSGRIKELSKRTIEQNEERLEAWRYIQEVLK